MWLSILETVFVYIVPRESHNIWGIITLSFQVDWSLRTFCNSCQVYISRRRQSQGFTSGLNMYSLYHAVAKNPFWHLQAVRQRSVCRRLCHCARPSERLQGWGISAGNHNMETMTDTETVNWEENEPIGDTVKNMKPTECHFLAIYISEILRDTDFGYKPVFLPGASQGRQSLVGCHLWGHTEWDTAEAT